MYSDNPPPIVVPDSPEGSRYVNREIRDMVPFAYCNHYVKGYDHDLQTRDDLFRPTDIPVCKNRSPWGSRAHNWCFRCMAGYPCVHLTPKERETDRAVITVM